MVREGTGRPPLWALVLAVAAVLLGVSLPSADRSAGESLAEAAATPATLPVAAFLGDSFTAASARIGDGGYVYATADALGWSPRVFGQGGTGYLNPGQREDGDAVYLERVPDVIAAEPDIVVVQGGGNDAQLSGCAIAEAAGEVFDALRAGLPEARIVAVASLPGPIYDLADFARCADALAEAAAERGVPLVDPVALGWMEHPDLFVDGVHPTADGYTQFAGLLAGELRRVLAV